MRTWKNDFNSVFDNMSHKYTNVININKNINDNGNSNYTDV